MEWIAYCTICGELDRAPNGPMMESTARLHRRDTGHTTIIGYEPSIIMSGKMVEVKLGGEPTPRYEEYKGYILEELIAEGVGGILVYTSQDAQSRRDAIRGEPTMESAKTWVDMQVAEEPPSSRPSPQTYGDWVELGMSIKEKAGIDDFETTAQVNFHLSQISEEDAHPKEAKWSKQMLTDKARELGIR